MRWGAVLLMCAAAAVVGGAVVKCTPGGDTSCLAQVTEKEHPVQTIKEYVRGTSPSEAECTPGNEWDSNCYSCSCSEAGRAVCERRKDCAATGPKKVASRGRECAAGSRWTSRCNSCFCSDDGRPACTQRACPGQETEPERQCAPDSTWSNRCNACWCTEDGQPACTRMTCIEDVDMESIPQDDQLPIMDEEIEIHPTISQAEGVEPKDTQTEIVVHVAKTERPDVEIEREPLEHSFEEIDYEVYESENELNHVHTVQEQNNLLEETDKRGDDERHILLKRSVCKPGQLLQVECNACRCSQDGQSFTCTHNECMEGEKNKEVEVFMESEGVDHIERHMVCAARGTFYIGCNTCHCNALGTDYSCSNKPCPLPEDVELFHELKSEKPSSKNPSKHVCVANRMFIKDCNTCWCNEDGTSFFCTRKVCVPELPEEGADDKPEELRIIKKSCRPDEVFELDCNTCRCSPDGQSYSCTRRACSESTDDAQFNLHSDKRSPLVRERRGVTQEARKACTPGQEFRIDCNTCLCDNEGKDFSCTRNDCGAAGPSASTRAKRDTAETVAVSCVAESVFDRECNVCRCAADGLHAVCTTRSCKPPPRPAPVTESDPNFRCNPGEQLTRGCNDCSCSADGRSIFCTVRFCDQDVTPPPAS